MRYPLVIWDFNGTLLDDVAVGVEAANRLLARRGLPLLAGVDDYYAVFGFPIVDYYKRMGFDFEKERYEDVAVEWVAVYNELEKNAPLREGVEELLRAVKRSGAEQVILSASEETLLARQVERLGIGAYFSRVLGRKDIYAHGKEDAAAALVERCGKGGAILVGDTEHDAEIARLVGADALLLSGGHQSEETLKKCGVPVTDTKGAASYLL